LVGDMDDNLFAKIQHNPHHVLYKLDHGVTLSHYLSRLTAEIT